jgi:hypothetical protein
MDQSSTALSVGASTTRSVDDSAREVSDKPDEDDAHTDVEEQASTPQDPSPSMEAMEPAQEPSPRVMLPTQTEHEVSSTPTSKPSWGLHAIGALACALGATLLLAPQLSAQAAQILGNYGGARLSAVALIAIGLFVCALGISRNALSQIRSSLDDVRGETACLEQIARDGRDVRETLHSVRNENNTLSADVVQLELKLKRVIEIVSNPDYTMSIFRLAASVDQLGKHVESSMKVQFGQMQQQVAAVAQHAAQAERQLSSGIGQIPVLMSEQNKAQQLALRAGIAELQSTAELADARIEQNSQAAARIEATLESQHAALSNGLRNLAEESSASANQIAANLGLLSEHLEEQTLEHSTQLRAEFKQLDTRLEQVDRNHVSAAKLINEQVKQQLGAQAGELQQSLRLLADLSGRNTQELVGELAALAARLDERALDQQVETQQIRAQAVEATQLAKSELLATVGQLASQLAKSEQAQRAERLEASQATQRSTTAASSELSARIDQLKQSLGQFGLDQSQAANQTAQAANEAAETTRREFEDHLEQLRVQLEQQARDQQAALRQSYREMQDSSAAAQRELAQNLEQRSAQSEQNAELRSNHLSNDLMEVAVMFSSQSAELRACIAESIAHLAGSPPSAPAAAVPAVMETEAVEPQNEPATPERALSPERALPAEPQAKREWANDAIMDIDAYWSTPPYGDGLD